VDATFCCDGEFQLVTVWGKRLEADVVPQLIFAALCNSRTRAGYNSVFASLKSKCPNFKPATFTCDFERAMWSSFQDTFSSQFQGCLFHLLQSATKQMHKKGVPKASRSRLKDLIRDIALAPDDTQCRIALELLWRYGGSPVEDGCCGSAPDCQAFNRYFYDSYICGGVAPVESWAAKDRAFSSVAGEPGRITVTNNLAENSHKELKKYVAHHRAAAGSLFTCLLHISEFQFDLALRSTVGASIIEGGFSRIPVRRTQAKCSLSTIATDMAVEVRPAAAQTGVGGAASPPEEALSEVVLDHAAASLNTRHFLSGLVRREVLAAEVAPRQAAVAEVASFEAPSGEMAPVEVASDEVASDEVAPDGVASDEAAPAEVRSAEVVSAEALFAEVRSAEVGSAEVGSAEVGSAEVRSAEVGSAEGPTEPDRTLVKFAGAGALSAADASDAGRPKNAVATRELIKKLSLWGNHGSYTLAADPRANIVFFRDNGHCLYSSVMGRDDVQEATLLRKLVAGLVGRHIGALGHKLTTCLEEHAQRRSSGAGQGRGEWMVSNQWCDAEQKPICLSFSRTGLTKKHPAMDVFRRCWGQVGADGLSDGHGTELCLSALALSTNITFTVGLMVGGNSPSQPLHLYYMQEFSTAAPYGQVVSTLATGPNTCAIINHGGHYWPWRGVKFADILESVMNCSPPKAGPALAPSKKWPRSVKERYDPEADARRPQWSGAASTAAMSAGVELFAHVSEMAVNDPCSGVSGIKLLPLAPSVCGLQGTHKLVVTNGSGCGTETPVFAPAGARASFSRPPKSGLKVEVSEVLLSAPVPNEPLRALRCVRGSLSAGECAVSGTVSAGEFLGFDAASGTVWLASEKLSKRSDANTPGSRGCSVQGRLVSKGEIAIRLLVPFSSPLKGAQVAAGDCDRRLVRDLVSALQQFSGAGPLVLLSKFKREGRHWGFSMLGLEQRNLGYVEGTLATSGPK
jgi:hypothetical protein